MIDAAHIAFGTFDLRLVKAFTVGLPHVEHDAGKRLAVEVGDLAGDEAGNSRRAFGHVAAVCDFRRIHNMKRPLDSGGRGGAGLTMVDAIDQHRNTEHVRGQDEFLALGIADLTGAGEPIDGREPFLLGRLDLAHEGMHVLDERGHDLAQTRIGNVAPALDRQIGQVLLRHEGHIVSPEWLLWRGRAARLI